MLNTTHVIVICVWHINIEYIYGTPNLESGSTNLEIELLLVNDDLLFQYLSKDSMDSVIQWGFGIGAIKALLSYSINITSFIINNMAHSTTLPIANMTPMIFFSLEHTPFVSTTSEWTNEVRPFSSIFPNNGREWGGLLADIVTKTS